jgi:predicted site-specific integrase-resolvase
VENRENREQPSGRLLKPAVVAGMFGIDRRTLLNWSKAGRIVPALRTAGGHGRYAEGDVLSLLAELQAVA